MKKKSQNWVQIQANVQSPFQHIIFGNSSHNVRKSRYQSFWSCPVLLGFLAFLVLLGFLGFVGGCRPQVSS